MSFSDSNRTGIRYIKETTWGVRPTGPVMINLPITSEGLKSDVNTVTSETIRDDRNVEDIIKVGGGASGDIGFELRFSDWDEFISAALQTDFVETNIASTGFASAQVSGAHVQADSSSLYNVVVGQFLRLSNASTVNNGDFRVTAVSTVSAGNKKVYLADASSGSAASFTSEVFGATTKFQGNHGRNGTTGKSYSIEKQFTDVSVAHEFTGMRIGNMSLNFETQSILTGSFAFVGKGQTTSSTSVASTITAASTNPVMNASGNVGRIWQGSDAISGITFQSITVELNNNTREQAQIGSDVLAGVATGRCEVTGSLTAYFEDNTLVDKFVNGTATSLRFQVDDSNGASYVITIPSVRITEGSVLAGGGNADVLQEFSWGGYIDSSNLYAIQVDILDA